jgi:hypothetical protein
MLALTEVVRTFPTARIPSHSGGLAVEVALIAQLGHGAGDELFEGAMARQRGHERFIDALDEPSARLAGVDLAKGDATSLYSFGVGAHGHPFHRHAGHRVFTAVSGSGGAQLRFSSASPEQIERDPAEFVRALRYVDIPPDSLFTVRFGGDTWHQFAPLVPACKHPAFFALSCHTNELGGSLSEAVRSSVLANEASIPMLTELLPPSVRALLETAPLAANEVPTIALSLDAPAGSPLSRFCALFRGTLGRVRGALARWRRARGFRSDNGGARRVEALAEVPAESLLRAQLGERCEHQDQFELVAEPGEVVERSATKILSALLDGFLENRPLGVTRLMTLRNALVRPLGLRTSPLGCPVSSLLCDGPTPVFAQRFPVLVQAIAADDTRAEVILGADDKHLRFRSCVGVSLRDGRVTFSLGTRVQCKNLFGRFYMGVIEAVHRGYIAPAMLRLAADHAIRNLHESAPQPNG